MNKFSKSKLEEIYKTYNKPEFIYPDPLWYIFKYNKKEDMEIVGLIASSLAYGNIKTIMKSVGIILDILGPNPSEFLKNADDKLLLDKTKNFVHRFAKSENISGLLKAIRDINNEFHTLENCFLSGYSKHHENILESAQNFTEIIHEKAGKYNPGHLIPKPEKKSSCKRLNLFFRWMIRSDNVDPGLWQADKSKLIIPLDTHMHKIGIKYGLTQKKGTGISTAVEITNGFKEFSYDDPVKYDFALTREGIGRLDNKIV